VKKREGGKRLYGRRGGSFSRAEPLIAALEKRPEGRGRKPHLFVAGGLSSLRKKNLYMTSGGKRRTMGRRGTSLSKGNPSERRTGAKETTQ